jgi:2-polyprenyl-3-methyl-5-hydroxy-6-metoxy-1,4-benzoquinol methylase
MVNRQNEYQYQADSIQPETLAIMPKGISNILDIGGGNGNYVAAAKSATGASIAAIVDVSTEAISNLNPQVDLASACDVEQPGSIESFVKSYDFEFDLILCLDVLEHLVDPWRVVSRLHAIMPEGGYLLASIPNVQNYRIAIRSISGQWSYRSTGLFDRTHLRYFARKSAIAMMTGTGLSLVATGRTFGPRPMDRQLHRLSLGILDPWVTMQNLILVRKLSPEIHDPGFCGDRIERS